jgi:hypothetical protein
MGMVSFLFTFGGRPGGDDVAAALARCPDHGDDTDARHDSGCNVPRLTVIFSRVLAIDVRKVEEQFARIVEIDTAPFEDPFFLGWIPREPVVKLVVYDALYSSASVYAIPRVPGRPRVRAGMRN